MCTSSQNGSIIAVKDAGKSFALKNPAKKNVHVTRVDGCAITSGIRCDYFYFLSSSREIFVELKGADIRKAINQIAASIPKLTKGAQAARAGVVVASRVPRADTSTQIAMANIRRHYLYRLIIRTGPHLQLAEADIFA